MRGGAGVRVGAGVNGWSKRVRLRGWAEVRGGAGVRGGAEVVLLLVSWLPSLGSGGCAPATSTMSGRLLLFMPTVILLFVVDGSRATAELLENEKMLCSNHKMADTFKSYYLRVGDSCCIKELKAGSNVLILFLLVLGTSSL